MGGRIKACAEEDAVADFCGNYAGII